MAFNSNGMYLFLKINSSLIHSNKKEWITVKQIQLFQEKKQCLCGRGNLKFVTYLKNKENQNEIIAGNCCLLTLKS